MRRCARCKKTKCLALFPRHRGESKGRDYSCKKCHAQAVRVHRKQHPDRVRASYRKWLSNPTNREFARTLSRRWKKNNLPRCRWLEVHRKPRPRPAMRAYQRLWIQRPTNKIKRKMYQRTYYKRHPDTFRVKAENRRARRLASGGSIALREWATLKAKFDFHCVACRRREPEIKLTMDHVIPLARGGHHVIENIQPLCQPCNSKKFTGTMDFRLGWAPPMRFQVA